jgi:hypothetical protein
MTIDPASVTDANAVGITSLASALVSFVVFMVCSVMGCGQRAAVQLVEIQSEISSTIS